MEELETRLKQAEKRLMDAVIAKDILEDRQGIFLIDYINDRISYLVTKMTGAKPLDEKEYLDLHGSISELKRLNDMLMSKAAQGAIAREESDAIREQLNQPR